MKKLIEGSELLESVPAVRSSGAAPVIRLAHSLVLDDRNFFQYPTLILGGVGSGKTTFLDALLVQILPHAEAAGDTVVIFAAKPDSLRFARPGDPVICVDSKTPDCCWNMFRDIDASDDPELCVREIATALFRRQSATLQPFFVDSARDIMISTLRYMYDYWLCNGGDIPSNGDYKEWIETTPIRTSRGTPGWMEIAENRPDYFGSVRDYIGGGTEQGLGVLSELRTNLCTFHGSFAAYGGTFSAVETMRKGGKRVFLFFDYAKASHSALSMFKLILDLLMKTALSHELKNKSWFVIDEFSLLPKLDHILDLLSFGRDPSGANEGAGCRLIACLQSAQLLNNHYPPEEAKSLLSCFPNVISMRVMDPLSRSVIADRYGLARYQYSYAGLGDRIHYVDCVEKVVPDYRFSLISKPGQAIMSLPGVCDQPFVFNGYVDKETAK